MAVKIFKISEYDHKAETKQFDEICSVLKSLYVSQDCLYIGNFNIEGVELDSLLITPYCIRIIEFKNWGGKIIAGENGNWTANGRIVEGGGCNKSPFTQMRLNRSRTSSGLSRLLQKDITNKVKGCVLFAKRSDIHNELSPTVKTWMDICDNSSIEELLRNDLSKPVIFSKGEISILPDILKISNFEIAPRKATSVTTHSSQTGYSKESASSLFSQLEERCLTGPIGNRVQALKDVFYRFVDDEIHDCRLTFSGLFSKVDYLIKENNISQDVSYKIHETRKSLFSKGNNETQFTEELFLYNLMDTCLFISLVKENAQIPSSLRAMFPKETRKLTWGQYETKRLRVIVNDWDDEYIYATEEKAGKELQICYSSKNQFLTRGGKGDWSYLKDMLWREAQLNLVRLRFDEEVCMPELIIFEPDYLVSITSIASCFEDHIRRSPFVGIVNKVAPSESSKYLQLGNLSGVLLDEAVHKKTNTFSESYEKFFHENIVEFMCDTQNPDAENFLRIDGFNQKKNIEKLIGEDITRIKNYNREKVVLEPSFFSEVLGIQGRLDFLYQDGEDVVIVEQKSGKGQYAPYSSTPDVPVPVNKHVVQLLMYRALFTYEFQKYAAQLKHIFLLYSKYPKGLVSIAQRPELMLEAIRMRNLLTWCEILYTRPGGFKILESITSKWIKDPQEVSSNFFEKYKAATYDKILSPLTSASPIEKLYYFRFQQFLAKEQLLSRMGNRTKDSSGFSSVWLDTLETKKSAGSIYDNLSIKSFGQQNGAVHSVTLAFPIEQSCDTTRFRKGDLAFLYSYEHGQVPNACAQMVHRGSIMDISEKDVTIRLTNDQTDQKVFEVSGDIRWAIEPDMIEAGSSSLYRNMHNFLSANKERRDLILFQREPHVNNDINLIGDYGEQEVLVLSAKRAQDYFLVIGPPGTGKTSHAMLNILQEELISNGRVLLLSYTNRAVDEMCSTLKKANINFMRIGNDLACGSEFVPNLLQNQMATCHSTEDAVNKFVNAKVICGTTASVNSHIALLGLKDFSLAIIDESSQILEPHLVGILSAKYKESNAIKKFVLIGDHKQLPAVVQQESKESNVTEPELLEIGLKDCRLSLFERLLDHFRDDLGNYNQKFVYMLRKQGRMHPDIAQFPNYAFYGNKLQNLGPEYVPHQGIVLTKESLTGNGIKDMLLTRSIAFVATPYVVDSPSDKINQIEANMIAATIIQIYQLEQSNFDSDNTIGVIVPYRNQISTISNTITNKAREDGFSEAAIAQLHNITIDTVERYQGSQRKFIIYGFTVQRPYQLNFLTSSSFVENGVTIDRKLNVAMTRAKEHLIIFGNPSILNENPTFYKMMEFVRSKNGYINVSPMNYCEGKFKVGKRSTDENICLDNNTLGISTSLSQAFEKFVIEPIKQDRRTRWPEYILGNSMDVNMTQINYGRIDFTNQMNLFSQVDGCNIALTPNDQVLIYAYYIMRMHYCSASAIYSACKEYLLNASHLCNGRVYVFDIGCGPATCGLALVNSMPSLIQQMDYCGIDVSISMKELGHALINEVCEGKLDMTFKESFGEFKDDYWERISTVPALVIFNMSYFFSNVSDAFTERLGNRIKEVMTKYPLNRYVFVIQNSELDSNIKSYKTFKKCLNAYVRVLKNELNSFTYQLKSTTKSLPFTYEIWEFNN